MGKGVQFVRIGLQRNILPIGRAVKNGSKWNYYISPKLFEEFTGIPAYEIRKEGKDA
jgi:hypothetical protein